MKLETHNAGCDSGLLACVKCGFYPRIKAKTQVSQIVECPSGCYWCAGTEAFTKSQWNAVQENQANDQAVQRGGE